MSEVKRSQRRRRRRNFEQFNLPIVPEDQLTITKVKSDTRTNSFIEKYGKLYVIELDALLAIVPDLQKYYFEDYNYIDNGREGFELPFAPGYVQYDEGFLDTYEKVRNEQLEDKIYNLLIQFLNEAIPTASGRRSRKQCKNWSDNSAFPILFSSSERLSLKSRGPEGSLKQLGHPGLLQCSGLGYANA